MIWCTKIITFGTKLEFRGQAGRSRSWKLEVDVVTRFFLFCFVLGTKGWVSVQRVCKGTFILHMCVHQHSHLWIADAMSEYPFFHKTVMIDLVLHVDHYLGRTLWRLAQRPTLHLYKVRLALRRSGYIGERLKVVMFNFLTGFCYHIIGESGGHGTKSAISECRTWCII